MGRAESPEGDTGFGTEPLVVSILGENEADAGGLCSRNEGHAQAMVRGI